jgi:hypothetical protein
MKTIQSILLLTALFCLSMFLVNCNKGKGSLKTVTVPFKADFIGNYTYVGSDTLPNPKCSSPLTAWRAIVDGKGTGTPGEFTAHFDFCGDAESNYGNVNAWMGFGFGDTLFISCSGRVIEGRLADHPAYVTSYWRDPFEILVGTGKFYGAKGNGTTDDYNSSEDHYSHHRWTGMITMAKESK